MQIYNISCKYIVYHASIYAIWFHHHHYHFKYILRYKNYNICGII